MKVAIIAPSAVNRGGTDVTLHHLMRQGRNLGVDWAMIFLEDGPAIETYREMGLPISIIPSGRLRNPAHLARTITRIHRILREEQVNLVFSWEPKAHLYGGPAAWLAGLPAVWFQHGVPSPGHWLDRMATLLRARGIFACSKASAEAQERYFSPRRPMHVLLAGVDAERFNPARLETSDVLRSKLGLPMQGPLIGIVGRLQRWKGMHVFLEALPAVFSRYPDAHGVIVGGRHDMEPEYADFLCQRAAELKIEAKVTFAGVQTNIPEWMQAMDVLVHASDNEPYGLVVLEAMASQKPLVAGNQGGPTEIITEGVNGLLTPYGDADALAAAILNYLDHPEYAQQVALAARKRALDFSTEAFARHCAETLLSLVPAEKRSV
jgi:glycosyltransferase involved in cell wall biosynthesis